MKGWHVPRSLVVAFVVFVFILLLSFVKENPQNPNDPVMAFLLNNKSHLEHLFSAIVIGSVLIWVFEASLREYLLPQIKDGFDSLVSAIAHEVRQMPETWKSITETITFKTITDVSENPEIKTKLAAHDEKSWNEAYELIKKERNKNPTYFLALAYRFWTRQNPDALNKAIEIAEIGLELSKKSDNHKSLIAKFKNSLAYYYAESGNDAYRIRAFEFIEAAKNERPEDLLALDTEGFVRIAFGDTREEINEGIQLCVRAFQAGKIPLETHMKCLERAALRMNALTTDPGN